MRRSPYQAARDRRRTLSLDRVIPSEKKPNWPHPLPSLLPSGNREGDPWLRCTDEEDGLHGLRGWFGSGRVAGAPRCIGFPPSGGGEYVLVPVLEKNQLNQGWSTSIRSVAVENVDNSPFHARSGGGETPWRTPPALCRRWIAGAHHRLRPGRRRCRRQVIPIPPRLSTVFGQLSTVIAPGAGDGMGMGYVEWFSHPAELPRHEPHPVPFPPAAASREGDHWLPDAGNADGRWLPCRSTASPSPG